MVSADGTIGLEQSWLRELLAEFDQPYMQGLKLFLREQKRAGKRIFPAGDEFFSAFAQTPLNKVKIVILGQDPYHGPGQAHGLAFSVKSPSKPPPSLKNIFKELDIKSTYGDLTSWAEQGVFLLNTVLTVRKSEAHSHKNKGWEEFTDQVIQALSENNNGIIFVLWGGPAQKKKSLIDADKHYILEAPHPSPLSAYRGFFGCDHFTEINQILQNDKNTPIDWNVASEEPYQPDLF